MRKLLAFSLILACSASARPALGCETFDARTSESTCVVMPLDERKGVWFDLETADGLRKLKLEVPELRALVKDYERSRKLYKFQAERYREAWALSSGVVSDLHASQLLHVRAAREAREERDAARAETGAWYRSPILWAGAGVTVTLGVGALVAYGLGSL